MKKFTYLFVIFILFSFLLVNCRKGESGTPAEESEKKTAEEVKSSDADDLLLTDKEVKSFIKAYPVFKKATEKAGKKFEGKEPKSVLGAMKTGKDAQKYYKRLNADLKPYGFTTESFMETYGKVMGSYSMMMMGDIDKLYDSQIKNLKETLKTPNIPDETKKEIKESIKELEEQKNSEESEAFKKNIDILKKYEEELKELTE